MFSDRYQFNAMSDRSGALSHIGSVSSRIGTVGVGIADAIAPIVSGSIAAKTADKRDRLEQVFSAR
jgi:hypothetical protein